MQQYLIFFFILVYFFNGRNTNIYIIIMSLRKQRITQHGLSNRLLNSTSKYQLSSPQTNKNSISKLLTNTSQYLQKTINKTQQQNQNIRRRSLPPQQHKSIKQTDKQTERLIRNIKSIYQDKRDIKKIVRGWKMHEKGYLEPQELKDICEKNLNINMTVNQAQNIINLHTKLPNLQSKLDTQGLVGLLFSKSDTLYANKLEQNVSANKNIKNLFDDANEHFKNKQNCNINIYNDYQANQLVRNYNSFSSKLRDIHSYTSNFRNQTIQDEIKESPSFTADERKAFNLISNQMNGTNVQDIYNLKDNSMSIFDKALRVGKFNKKKYHQYKSSIMTQQNQYQQSFQNKLQQTNGYFLKSQLNTKQKKIDFDPKQFTAKNQRKLRLQKTPFITIQNCNKNLQFYANRSKNSKYKVDLQLLNDRNKQKMIYGCKLDKIRRYRQQQVQNIRKSQEKLQRIDQSNLMKRKRQLQAYNYVNYVQNEWR